MADDQPEAMLTEGVTMSPVDVATLPSLSDLFGGQLDDVWRREASLVLANLFDPKTDPEKERTITIVLSFLPEADRRRVRIEVKKAGSKLNGGALPDPGMLILGRQGSAVTVGIRHSAQPIQVASGPATPPRVDPENMPRLAEICAGNLDLAWRHELIRVVVNCADPRTRHDQRRTITLELSVRSDVARQAIEWQVAKTQARIAGALKPKASILYVDVDDTGTLRLEPEPAGVLPGPRVGEVVVGRQSSLTHDDADDGVTH
ncbi:MAG: hypothetical protein AAGE94_08335 [Acidobacteriota bacterium]